MNLRHSPLRHLNTVFAVTVAVPTLLAAVYFGLVASDVYISESRFVVRDQEHTAQVGLGALLQSTGISSQQDGSYLVRDYILSRDALRELDTKLKLRTTFASNSVDAFDRFASFGRDSSFEALYLYYGKHVGVEYDSSSSIAVLRVDAFTARDAQQINELLLQMSEKLVNQLNERSRQDLIDVAQREVKQAEQVTLDAAMALSSFRNGSAVFDPAGQSALQIESATRLQQALIEAEGQLAEVRRVSPQNPQVETLKQRVGNLRGAIAAENLKVTGGGQASLSGKAPAYDRLVLQKSFADHQLAAALASLSDARREADRKQLYLERLVQPNLPDSAMEPRRIRSVLAVLVLGLVLWGVVSLLLASVREHAD